MLICLNCDININVYSLCRTEELPKDLSKQLENIIIKNPIEQIFMRQKSGSYIVTNVERTRNYTVEQWAQFCRKKHMPPEPRYWNPRIPPKLSKKESPMTTITSTTDYGPSTEKSSMKRKTVPTMLSFASRKCCLRNR